MKIPLILTGVILLNLGGPDSLQAVRPFLYNLFSDREIIRLGPASMQKPLAWLISTLRSPKTEKMYSQIGGKSPILDITRAQAVALEEALNKKSNSPHSFKVYIGMRYWRPFTEEVVEQMSRDGIKKVIGLSLYPQYSVTTSGSSISEFRKAASRYGMEIIIVDSWHNHPLYIEALVDVIKRGLASFERESNPHILFSAHSLPQKIIDQGDPYVDQTVETIREIEKLLPITWHLSYQSKSGPVKWLEPSTEDKLEELAHAGIKNVLVVPISFVSDHIETLYEIDILYKDLAGKLGINLKRTESLNDHPKFIAALQDIVEKSLKN
ncbi:MAG: ferrochelatase [Nitrospirae bacterium]|nr:ferrochelatase [Nitrospirota bacterium]